VAPSVHSIDVPPGRLTAPSRDVDIVAKQCRKWSIAVEHQPPVGGWGSGGAEDIIAKLEEHRLARAAAAPGVAPSTFQNQPNSTANGLSAARRFLNYWCTLDAVERAENQAFRDWHAANIKP